MAIQKFLFPSIDGFYKTKFGNIRIEIYYSDSVSNTIETGGDILKITNLSIPLLLTPQDDEYKFSELKIDLKNNNNIFENYPIFTKSKENETFIDIYKDDVLFWRGIVDLDSVEKLDWYASGSNLFYRKVSIKAYDALYYFKLNPKTLADVSYSDGITIQNLFENIIAQMGFAAADLFIDSNLKFYEPCGNYHDLSDLRLKYMDTGQDVLAFIKEFMQSMGTFVFIFNGKFQIIKKYSNADQAINLSDILKIKEKENPDPLKYLKFQSTRDWSDMVGSGWGERTDIYESGNPDVDQKQQFIIISNLIKNIYAARETTEATENFYPANAGDTDYIKSEEISACEVGVEIGDRIRYNYEASGGYSSIITDLNYNDGGGIAEPFSEFWFYSGDAVDDALPAYIDMLAYRFKQPLLVRKIGKDYADYYLKSGILLSIQLKNAANYFDLTKRFNLFSKNWKIYDLKLDLVNGYLFFTLIEVA